MKPPLNRLARLLLGEYSAYYMFAVAVGDDPAVALGEPAGLSISSVDEAMVLASGDPLIRAQADYAGSGSHAYACLSAGRIISVCFYWHGDRYRQRAFWPLADGEAKLVQVISLPDFRGRGLASALIAMSCRDMMQKGFARMYARVWYSNAPSLRAFENAGWFRVALVIEVDPLRRNRPKRITVPLRRTTRRDRQMASAGGAPAARL